MKIEVRINSENKTELLEKANEFIDAGYTVDSIKDEEDKTGTVYLSQDLKGDEDNEKEEYGRFEAGELTD